MPTQSQMLYNQERDFMSPGYTRYQEGFGTNVMSPSTTSALQQSSAQSRFNAVSNPGNYGTDFNTQADQLGLAESSVGAGTGAWGKFKGGLQNESLMKGLLGAGQLGLGVLSYLDDSKVRREQLKGMKQNRQQAAKNFQDQQSQRAAINAGFSSALS